MVNDSQDCFTENMSCSKKSNFIAKVTVDKETA